MSKKLPDKPSELLRLALDDFNKIRDTPGYYIDMSTWHDPCSELCYVCMAGCVLASTLNVPKEKYYDPGMFDSDTGKKLRAINLFRQGYLDQAFHELDLKSPPDMPLYAPRSYVPNEIGEGNYEEFEDYILRVIGILKEAKQ